MLLISLGLAQPRSLIAESTTGLVRDPIDYAGEPALLGNTEGAHVLGTLAARSVGIGLGTVRPFGLGQMAMWAEGSGLRVSEDLSTTVEGETSGSLQATAVSGGQLWLAFGNGRAGLALGSNFGYQGQTAVAQFYGVPLLGAAPYDPDTDTGLYTYTFFQQDLVLGLGLSDARQTTELDLLYRYELLRPYVQATTSQANQRFETKGLYETASLLENRMGHSGGLRLDSMLDLESGGQLRILVEARVGVFRAASDSLIDIAELDGETIYRRDLELQNARLITAQGSGLLARHHELERVELRYGLGFAVWTGGAGWTRVETVREAEETTLTEQEHVARWNAIGLSLPAVAMMPVSDHLTLWVAGSAGWGLLSSDDSYLVQGGDGGQTTASGMSTFRTGVVGVRIEPSDHLTLDLATTNFEILNVSGVWHF